MKRRGACLRILVVLSVIFQSARGWAGEIQVSEVVQGSATVSKSGSQTTINAANNTIVNYMKFNVDAYEAVRFIQPSEQARILNRVIGGDPSYLLGSIQANGQVYFVNPAGVVIGAGATINASQFFAAAGNITDADFLGGVDRFTTSGGALINNGNIHTANGTVLVGDTVLNTGSIVSDNGLVAMCSGKEVYLAKTDSGVKIRVDNLDASTGAGSQVSSGTGGVGVSNQGSVEAGEVVFSCGDVYSLAVVNSGQVRSKGGSVTLSGNAEVRNTGQIDVSNRSAGGVGGRVKMLGETVVVEHGSIDASGSAGGGEILLGGSYQGSGQERNASLTFVNPDSTIVADATDTGNGGRIIVWSNDKTGFYGALSAKGAMDGIGGFAEISGLGTLGLGGQISLTGGQGLGTLLLDPANIIVALGGGGSYSDVSTFGAASGSDVTIAPSTLDDVGGNVALQATNNITVSDALMLNTEGASLSMRAGNNVTVDAPVTTSGGTITMTANDRFGTQTGSGSILINANLSTTGNGATGANVTFNVDGGTGSVDLNAPLDLGTTGSVVAGSAETVRVMSNAASIQDAIDAVTSGGTVKVLPDSYTENFSISKSLSLIGVETDGTTEAWTTGTAGASGTAPVLSATSGTIITLAADDVTISGFDIDTTLGTAQKGISVTGSSDALTLRYCTFDYDSTDLAVTFNPSLNDLVFDGTTIDHSIFNAHGSTESWAILMGNATDLAITNNTFDTGIKFAVGGGSQVTSDVLISGNTFNDYDSPGIKFIRDGSGSIGEDFVIEQNDFNSRSIGIYFFATSDDGSTDPDADYSLTASNFSDAITIQHNKFHAFGSGTEYALQVAEDDTALAITIDARENYWDSVNGPTYDENRLNVGSQGAEILNGGSATIKISPWWSTLTNDAVGAYAGTLLIAVENVTTNVAYTSFADAIAAAAPGDELRAVAGLYGEDVVIDKDLTINGTTDLDEFTTAYSWTSNTSTSVQLGGNFATTGGNFTFNGEVTLDADTVLNSAGGNILFGALNGGGYDLTLAAAIGTGTTTFGGVVSDLGSGVGAALTVEDGVTGWVTFSDALSPTSGLLVQGSDSQVRFDGAVTLGNGDTGTTIEGDLVVGATCSAIRSNDGFTVAGSTVLENGTSSLQLNTNASSMTFHAFDAGDRNVIVRSGTGSGSLTFAGAVTNLGSGLGPALTVESGVTGTIRFQDTLSANSGLSSLNGSNLRFDGDVTITGDTNGTSLGGNVTLDGMTFSTDGDLVLGTSTSNSITLSGLDVVLDVADQDVTLKGTVNGSSSFTIQAGSGNVTINGPIGATTSPSNLTVSGAEISTTAALKAAYDITMTANAGNLTLGGNLTADDTIQLNAPAGALIQTSGTVTAWTVDLNSADGVYGQLDLESLGLEDDPPSGYDNLSFFISATNVSAAVTGAGKINLENACSGNTIIDSLTTAGGYINYTNTGSGTLYVNGAVTSGVTGVVDGGDINIVAAGPVVLNASVDSSSGTGGTITVINGVTVNVAPTAGAGDILVVGSEGEISDLYINTAIVRASDISLSSERDIYIRSDVITTEGYNITLTADSDNDGVGGVLVYEAGNIESGGTLTITGADLYLTTDVVDAIVIESDLAAAQLTAGGNITLTVSDVAPEDALIRILGLVQSTGDGYVAVYGTEAGVHLDGSIVPDTYLISAAGGVYFDAPVTLLGNTALNSAYLGSESDEIADGSIWFVDTLDGAFALTLNAGAGNIYGYEYVGATTSLGGLTVTSAGTVLFSGDVSTKGQDGQAGGDIIVDAEGDIIFEGDIDTSGGDAVAGAGLDGGTVRLTSAEGSVTVEGITTSGSDAVAGAGGDAGDVTLQPATSLTLQEIVDGDYFPDAMLEIHGDIIAEGGAGVGGADGAGGHVALSPAGRSAVSAVATITNGTDGGDITIRAGSIEMGQNEKFTVVDGDLNLLADGAITLGDLTVSGDLTVVSGSGVITALLRETGLVLLADGTTTTDTGLDIICGGTMSITGTVHYGGVAGSSLPVFAAGAYAQPVLAEGSTQLTLTSALSALVYDSTRVLDAVATGEAGPPGISPNEFVQTMPGMPNEGLFTPASRHWTKMLFKSLDENWDGYLDYDEFKACFGETQAWFASIDKNDDKKLSLEEFQAAVY